MQAQAFARLAFGAAFLSTGLGTAHAQLPDQPVSQDRSMGVNLTAVHDYTPEWRFVDVFKMSREWIPQVPGFGGPFDTGVDLTLTADGWPLLNAGEAAGTLMLHDLDGHYPGGVYTVLYDGTGTMTFSITRVDSESGEFAGVFTAIQPSDSDMGGREPVDVKVSGELYGRLEQA